MNDSLIEIIEVLDGVSWAYSNDPEFLDVLVSFREEINNEFDREKRWNIVGEYVQYWRRIFRDYPEVMKLSKEYT